MDDERGIGGATLQLDPQPRHWAAHFWKSIGDRHAHWPRIGAADFRLGVSRDLAQENLARIRCLKSIDEDRSGGRQPGRKRLCLAALQDFGEAGRGSQDGELRMTRCQRGYIVPVRFGDCQRRPRNFKEIENFRQVSIIGR